MKNKINLKIDYLDFISLFFSNNSFKKKLLRKNYNFFKRFFSSNKFIFFNKGRFSLYVYLQILKKNYPHKKNVLISPFTLVNILEIIISCDLNPIFINYDDSLNYNLSSIKNNINQNTLAIIINNINGIDPNIKNFKKLLDKYDTKIIEDRAINFIKLNSIESDFYFFSLHFSKSISSICGGIGLFKSHKDYIEAKRYIYSNKIKRSNFFQKDLFFYFIFKLINNLFLNKFFKFIFYYSEILSLKKINYIFNNDINNNIFFDKKITSNSISLINNFNFLLTFKSINSFKNLIIHKKRIDNIYFNNIKNKDISKISIKDNFNHEFILKGNLQINKCLYLSLLKNNFYVRRYYYRDCRYISYFNKSNQKNHNNYFSIPNSFNISEYDAKSISNIISKTEI